jgi:hypothetical protein
MLDRFFNDEAAVPRLRESLLGPRLDAFAVEGGRG